MDIQKERKRTFLIAFEVGDKETRSLFAAQHWYRSCLWMSAISIFSPPLLHCFSRLTVTNINVSGHNETSKRWNIFWITTENKERGLQIWNVYSIWTFEFRLSQYLFAFFAFALIYALQTSFQKRCNFAGTTSSYCIKKFAILFFCTFRQLEWFCWALSLLAASDHTYVTVNRLKQCKRGWQWKNKQCYNLSWLQSLSWLVTCLSQVKKCMGCMLCWRGAELYYLKSEDFRQQLFQFCKSTNKLLKCVYSLRVLDSSTTCQYTREQSDRLLVWNDRIFFPAFLGMPQSYLLQLRLSKDEEIHCRLPSETLPIACSGTKRLGTFKSQLYPVREYQWHGCVKYMPLNINVHFQRILPNFLCPYWSVILSRVSVCLISVLAYYIS